MPKSSYLDNLLDGNFADEYNAAKSDTARVGVLLGQLLARTAPVTLATATLETKEQVELPASVVAIPARPSASANTSAPETTGKPTA